MSKFYKSYKRRAEASDREFNITESQFTNITKGNCFYCGVEFDKDDTEGKHVGVDRVINSEGYTFENCIASCWICNRAKSDLSTDDFFKWISRLSTHQKTTLDISLSLDKRHSALVHNAIKANSFKFNSYEEDALSRALDCVEFSQFLPEYFNKKLVSFAMKKKQYKELLVKYIFSLDMLNSPAVLIKILEELGTPDYLIGFDSKNKIATSCLSDILLDMSFNKKENKILMAHLKNGQSGVSFTPDSHRFAN